MAKDFRSARYWAADLIEGALHTGSLAIDATLGNGHDALWLCKLVGATGRVIGFDIQAEAVSRSHQRLESAHLASRAQLICDGHEHMSRYVAPDSADVVMFNLGWLPGAEHIVTTRVDTTLQAVNFALTALRPEGLLTICVYPGHAEGARERDALLNWARALDGERYDALLKTYLNQRNDPPLLIAVKRKRGKMKR